MGKTSSAIIGATIGAVAGFIVVWKFLFGPANDTTFDKNYQSRPDRALEKGNVQPKNMKPNYADNCHRRKDSWGWDDSLYASSTRIILCYWKCTG